jgi:hypothetical protein
MTTMTKSMAKKYQVLWTRRKGRIFQKQDIVARFFLLLCHPKKKPTDTKRRSLIYQKHKTIEIMVRKSSLTEEICIVEEFYNQEGGKTCESTKLSHPVLATTIQEKESLQTK